MLLHQRFATTCRAPEVASFGGVEASGRVAEKNRMYDELLAVHTVLRRAAALTAAAMSRLATGEPVDVETLVRVAHWQHEFLRRHRRHAEVRFWPVLRDLFPGVALNSLRTSRTALDAQLSRLVQATDDLEHALMFPAPHRQAAAVGIAAALGEPAAARTRDLLIAHLDHEELTLWEVFPRIPAYTIETLRRAVADLPPRSAPELVLGLLSDPRPAPGAAAVLDHLPAAMRLARPAMVERYEQTKRDLAL